jgi:hypothetical protein
MLILAGTILSLLLVPLLRGQLGRLADLRLAQPWLIASALGLQVLCISVIPGWPRPLLVSMHAASYVLAAVFVWRNRALPGLPLLALGGFLNAFTIALNGGTLPASRSALLRAGLPVEEKDFINSGVLAHPKLGFLGDVFASPSWLPLHNVYSVGDLLILAGAVWLVNSTCQTVLGRLSPLATWRGARAATTVPIDRHLDTLDLLEEVMRERDEAVAALRAAGARNDELRRELVRARHAREASYAVPLQAVRQTVAG